MAWTLRKLLTASALTASCGWGADSTLHVRLLNSLSSQSPDGTDFESVVTKDWPVKGPVAIPSGSRLKGKVIRARQVGFALRRENALLELGFSEYVLADGSRYPIWGKLRGVDNAREKVNSAGRINGVHAASGPGGWVQGFWFRPPNLAMLPRSLAGFVGLSGTIGRAIPLGFAGDAGLLVLRSLVFTLPKSEIQLPTGTDLRIGVTSLSPLRPNFAAVTDTRLTAEIRDWLAEQPAGVSEANGKPVRDLINVSLIGSLEEVTAALTGAGWSQADPISRDSFGRSYRAFTSMSGYQKAPVSPIHYRDGLPDLVFEKSFNSIAKRHHIRLWRGVELDGREIWLGAASHDVNIALKKWPITFTHQIDPRIDSERERVAEDLRFARCADAPAFVDRPELAADKPKDGATTDGRMVVLSVVGCSNPVASLDADDAPKEASRHIAKRAISRLVLEARYHLMQGNIYYQGFNMLFRRHDPLPAED